MASVDEIGRELEIDEAEEVPQPATGTRRPKKPGKLTATAVPAAEQPTFWETVGSFEEREWSQHTVYLYRLLPKIDSGSDRNYVAKYNRAFDEATVLADHGSGKYQALLNNTKIRKAVDKVIFGVYAENSPPKVRANQILDLPENEPYRDWVRDAGKQLPSPVEFSARGGTDNDVTRRLVEVMAQHLERKDPSGNPGAIDPTLVGLFQESSRQRDQLAERLATHQLPTPAADPIAMFSGMLNLVEKMSQRNVPAAPDPLLMMERAFDMITKVKTLSGSPNESIEPPGIWERVSGMFANMFAPAMPTIAQAIITKMAGQQPPQQPFQQPMPQQQYQQQPPMPDAAAVPVAAMLPPPPPAIDPQTQEELQQLLFRIAPAMLMRLQSGASGLDFADWLIDGEGLRPWQLVKNVGRESLLATLKQFPAAWAMVQPMEQRFLAFLDEFLDWTPIEQEQEEPPAPEPPPQSEEAPPSAEQGEKPSKATKKVMKVAPSSSKVA